MRINLWQYLAVIVFLVSSDIATAATLYSCKSASGALSYQDKPCAPGTEVAAPEDVPVPPFSAKSIPLLEGVESLTPEVAAELAKGPVPKLLRHYRCRRFNGDEYVTTNAIPLRYKVSRVTHEKFHPPQPSKTSAANNPQPFYVEVEDQCQRLQLSEICEYWRESLVDARISLPAASGSEVDSLNANIKSLQRHHSAHCGR